MTSAPTLVCVHAHPDDEALFTAGVTSHYGVLGYRVVLITCTNGQLGIDDHGRPGSDPLHDDEATCATRAAELQRAAIVAGFTRVVTLGYDDSGMKGWPQNDLPDTFMNADVAAVARTIAAILDEEHAAVVITYDENGFYGHPDHVMANVVTRAAIELAASPQRLYYPVVPGGRPRGVRPGRDKKGRSIARMDPGRYPHGERRNGRRNHGRSFLRDTQTPSNRDPRFPGR